MLSFLFSSKWFKRKVAKLCVQRNLATSGIDRVGDDGRSFLATRKRNIVPRVRILEPRLVLNASAELSDLGQLLIFGTDADETVQVNVDPLGNIQLFDGDDLIIPIANHPDGPTGQNNPLSPNAITADQIRIDLGGGDDTLQLDFASGLSISVVAGDGLDTTEIRQVDPGFQADDVISIDSETIRFDSDLRVADFSDASVRFIGDVSIGQTGQRTQLNVGLGDLLVDGSFVVQGDVNIAAGGPVDLSGAVISASAEQSNLRMLLDDSPLLLGTSNDSGGQLVEDFVVVSAESLTIVAQGGTSDPGFSIAGDFTVRDAGSITSDAAVNADSLLWTASDEIQINASIQTAGGSILLSTSGSLSVQADLNTAVPDRFGAIDVSADSILLADARLTTSGGQIRFDGPLDIDGSVAIDSGNGQSARSGGRIEFFDEITAFDGVDDRLSVEALGQSLDGFVVFSSTIGTPNALLGGQADPTDLQGLDIRAGQIQLVSIGVAGGDVQLIAPNIRLLGSDIEISDSGNLVIEGQLFLPVVDTRIDVAGNVTFQGAVQGQPETRNLLVDAGGDLVVADQINRIVDFRSRTGGSTNLLDRITVSGSFSAMADGSISGASIVAMGTAGAGNVTLASGDGDILLASVAGDSMPIIETTDGEIVLDAGGSVTVSDNSPGDAGPDRSEDPDLVARGQAFGRIDITAGTSITLGDDVQLLAEKETRVTDRASTASSNEPFAPSLAREDRAIVLNASQPDSFISLGENIQFDTGQDQGRARVFAPRPFTPIDRVGNSDIGRAFFDPASVDVNILEQAQVNDATGILSLNIGQTGEFGLRVVIDWGAARGRFQELTGLSADARINVGVSSDGTPQIPSSTPSPNDVLTVTHFYSEDDILESLLNGRASATAPLNVLFAVSQHESILIQGNEVRQSGFEVDVEGGLISGTDNPQTAPNAEQFPGLESGRASFIIPNLSIPVAFFPTRDVIPELETTEFVIREETQIALTQTIVETTETTSSSVVNRDEFFQLRVLSADPNGPDLAPPQKLEDDILDGDKLQELFAELPDGAYEIEFVLSDGNERSILRVDVRDGEATIPDDEFDREELRLRRIDLEPESDEKSDPPEALDPSDRPADRSESGPDPVPVAGKPMDRSITQPRGDLPHGEIQTNAIVIPAAAMWISAKSLRRRRKRSQSNDHVERLSRSQRFVRRRVV